MKFSEILTLRLIVFPAILTLCLIPTQLQAQEEVPVSTVVTEDGKTVVIRNGEFKAAVEDVSDKEPRKKRDKKGDDKDGGSDESEDSEKKSEKGEEKADDTKVIKRPTMSDKPAKPIADEVSLTNEGKVSFDLKDQPWETVLQWIADSSKLSFDWQELPGDTLNLTTSREYSLPEARDILNRHLLARGYCMVLNGELLSVLKIADIKTSLVPRVQPEELKDQLDHTLCKVSFDLQWLIADEAVEELAPMLSKAGRISKLSRTNRLEVMDTAASLRDIYAILQAEQSDTGHEQLVRTFRLEHRRAHEVIELLRSLLGLEEESTGRRSNRSGGGMGDFGGMMRQMQEQMREQMQHMGNQAGKKGGGGKEPRKTRLVLNQRENMILAQAEPDQMALIEKAIEQIDVAVTSSNSLISNINRMKVYRMETVDPQILVDLLQELGDMSPGTVLKVDEDGKSIMAFASLADHLTISTLVERLDQSARRVEVVPLRRLDADYVAGTIRALMGPPPEKQNNSRYSYYSRYSQPQQQEKDDREFKVEADIENNRLLVYANRVEMDEIMILLQKLGEITDPNAADDGIRVFELGPNEDPHELMERIKGLWRRKNELEINIPKKEKEDEANDEKSEPSGQDEGDSVTAVRRSRRPKVEVWPPEKPSRPGRSDALTTMLAEQNSPTTAATRESQSGADEQDLQSDRKWSPVKGRTRPVPQLTKAQEGENSDSATENDGEPPIRFSTTPDGHLIMSSDDKLALQEMEDLMRQVVKPTPRYKVFYLKYATPSWVTLNLEEYFESDAESSDNYRFDPWFGFMPSNSNSSSSAASLGKRRLPQFIYDNFTSSILVRNADRRQLQTIQELIDIYDVPEPADTRSMRVTKVFRLQNTKAEAVSQAVKDVFRDLLSSNDKALQKKEGEKTQTRVFSYFGDTEDDTETPIRFKGLLSIGVEPNSDTLVVSSTASLMETLSELIIELDRAGERSSLVQVLKLDPSVDVQLLQQKLQQALGGTGTNSTQQSKPKPGPGQFQNGIPIGARQNRGE